MSEETPAKQPPYENVKCPECDGPMISRSGKYGVFWGCKAFPRCTGTRDSMGRSKQDREEYKIKKAAEGEEWQRNKEDKISWNRQENENPAEGIEIDRDSGKPVEHTKASFNKKRI